MTCIAAAILSGGRRCIAADTYGEDRYLKFGNRQKIGHTCGILWGCAGQERANPILQEAILNAEKSTIDVVPTPAAVRDELEKLCDRDKDRWEATALLVRGSQIWRIGDGFGLNAIHTPIMGAGSGQEIAIGYLDACLAHASSLDESHVRAAVQAAIRWSVGCGGEVRLLVEDAQ